MARHSDSTDTSVYRHIRKAKPGSIFTPRDLAHLGTRLAVASALTRHVKAGTLTRPARGLYQVPKADSVLGQLRPSPNAIAQAVGSRDKIKLQPAGAYAANLLGLSAQVPLKIVYLTDGTPRKIRLGKQQVVLRRTTPRNMAAAGRISGLVIQALRHLGKDNVDDATVAHLRRTLNKRDRAQLKRDAHFAPAWIAARMREIANGAQK